MTDAVVQSIQKLLIRAVDLEGKEDVNKVQEHLIKAHKEVMAARRLLAERGDAVAEVS